MYDNYIKRLNDKFTSSLQSISAEFNFDLGPEFEIAICNVLREFLPDKYGVCRGFVVDRKGNKAGDDIIIYDKIKYPTIRQFREDFSRKENIPIEAVYAYIEAKHTIDMQQYDKAIEQIQKVKELCSTRSKTGIYQTDPYIGEYIDRSNVVESLPRYRNPIIAIILGRFSVDKLNNRTTDPELIQEMAFKKLSEMKRSSFNPEMIILGGKNVLRVGYSSDNNSVPTLFFPDNNKEIGYQNLILEDMAYGLFMTQLMAAMDWIKLGNLPWVEMINEIK